QSELFWPALIRSWSACDDIWTPTSRLLEAMRNHDGFSRRQFYSKQQLAFWDRLPDPINVFRACSRYRIRGVSWTTDPTFSRERLSDWVLSGAVIPKSGVFFVTDDSGIVLDPDRLRDIRMY